MFKKKMMCLGIFVAILSLCGFTSAGDLEPTDPPGPTMKTLDEMPPTWSQKLPAADRFDLVLDGAAVLDKETGLVWEQNSGNHPGSWFSALTYCTERNIGGRRGWHLPTVEQLLSLVDSTQATPPLPVGHPFTIGTTLIYWTSTTIQASYYPSVQQAWAVEFLYSGGPISGTDVWYQYYDVWCVRGGQTKVGNGVEY